MQLLLTLDLFRQIFLSFLVLIFLTFAGPAAASQPIKFILAWDANSEEDLGGYEIYFRTLYSDYGFLDDVHVDELEDPYNPMVTITDLHNGELPDSSIPVVNVPALAMVEGATYYFSLTAFDVQGNTSDFSDELCLEVTGSSVAVCKSLDSSDDSGGGGGGGGGGCFISATNYNVNKHLAISITYLNHEAFSDIGFMPPTWNDGTLD